MTRKLMSGLLLAAGLLVSTGCAGYDRILFVTKTNIGLDIDDKPPTAELTIARRELAITPTFQDATGDNNTLPLLASFGLTGSFLDPAITSRFAGGEAAVILAQGPTRGSDDSSASDSSLLLCKKPDTRPWWKRTWQSIFGEREENTRPFFFATDTSFGLKAAWDGSTGPYPSTLKLGYNRKEIAFPPIFATPAQDKATCPNPPVSLNASGTPSNDAESSEYTGPWKITVPSFLASLDNSSTLHDVWEWGKAKKQAADGETAPDEKQSTSGVTHIQFIATGKAATEFVKRTEVNSAMNQAMYPHDPGNTP